MRVSAVSYLNTWPLVWGFIHGPGRGLFDFRFDLPSQCADALATGEAEVGLVPCAELDRLGLDFLPDLGIACDGPVRSILLISKTPFGQIGRLAADAGSRTSVALARIVLAERYGCSPKVVACEPRLDRMLEENDAALIIGDPALRIQPDKLPWRCLDLGREWVEWTGLPMVFAVWAGRRQVLTPEVARTFAESYEWGAERIGEVVREAVAMRGFEAELVRAYLTRNIVYRLGAEHRAGLELFREKVRGMAVSSAV